MAYRSISPAPPTWEPGPEPPAQREVPTHPQISILTLPMDPVTYKEACLAARITHLAQPQAIPDDNPETLIRWLLQQHVEGLRKQIQRKRRI